MGAAQDDGVGSGIQQRLQGCPDNGFGFGAVQNALFYQFDEAAAHLFHNLDIVFKPAPGMQVFGPLQRPGGGEDPDHAGPGAERSRFHGRLHPDEGNVRILGPEGGDGGCRGGIACDHEDVGSHAKKDVGDGAPTLLDVFYGLFSVGAVGVVGKVEIPFFRKCLFEFPEHRQAAAAGIEYADCCHLTTNIRRIIRIFAGYLLTET